MLESTNKYNFLLELLNSKADTKDFLALVFCRTKHGASKLAKRLNKDGIKADAIHGDKTHSARQKALDKFKNRAITALVATDIAARGIDVKNMNLVVNYDLPDEPETYVHRIGRTARAEADGEAVSICTRDNVKDFYAVEKFIRQNIPLYKDTQYHSESVFEDVQKMRALRAKADAKRQPQPKRVKDKDFSAESLYGERRPTVFLEREQPKNFARARDENKPRRKPADKRGAHAKHGSADSRPQAHSDFGGKRGGGKFGAGGSPRSERGAHAQHNNKGARNSAQKPFRPQKQKRIRKQFVRN